MTSRLAALGVALLVGSTVVLGRQQPVRSSQAPSATGLVLGRVVDAESNAPLPGVVVMLASDAMIAALTPEESGPPRRALTDGQGQFVFRRLPKGRYTLTATVGGHGFSPSGFLVTGRGVQIGAYLDGGYGQRRPAGPMQTIDLAEGQRLGDVVVRLWKGGALNGTVYDEAGEPLVGMIVSAVRRSSDGRLLTGPTTATDDRGMYHLGTLAPGEYLIVVPQTQVLMPLSSIDALLSGPPDPTSTARFRNAGAPSPPTMGVLAGASVATMAPDNTARVINTLAPAAQADALFAYQTTFYPLATVASRATPVPIDSGRTRSGLDIRLRPVRTVEVSGTLMDTTGPVPDFGVHLVPADVGDGSSVLEVATTATDARGVFTFPLIPSGQYALLAFRTAAVPTANAGRGGPPPPPPTARTVSETPGAFATETVTVGEDNVRGLMLMLRPGVRISGRVEFQGTSAPLAANRLRQLVITAAREPPFFRDGSPRGVSVIDADGQFAIVGLPPGRYVVGAPDAIPAAFLAPWSMQSVTADGRDIGDIAVALDRDLTDVVMTFTDRPAEVNGSVQGGNGAADPYVSVFLFPRDAARWPDARSSTRTLRTVRVSKSGAFTIPNVMPGDYLLSVATDDGAGNWPDETFLRTLAGTATMIHVDAAAKQTVSLKMAVLR